MKINVEARIEGKTAVAYISSDIDLHPDTIWALANEALANADGQSVSHLSRVWEAYDILQGESGSYAARYQKL